MGEGTSNTSKYTSCFNLLGAFMVIVVVFEICIILGVLFNCVTQLQIAEVGQGWPKSKHGSGSLTPVVLPNMNILGQVISILEPED